MKKRSAFLSLALLATLGFMLGSVSCTSKQQKLFDTGVSIAERRGLVKAEDVADANLILPLLLPVDQTSSK